MYGITALAWLTWWAFLGLKLSAAVAWPWLIVFIPLMVAVPLTIAVVAMWVIAIVASASIAKEARKNLQDMSFDFPDLSDIDLYGNGRKHW